MFNSLKRAIGGLLADFLSKDLPGYQRLDTVAIVDVAMTFREGRHRIGGREYPYQHGNQIPHSVHLVPCLPLCGGEGDR